VYPWCIDRLLKVHPAFSKAAFISALCQSFWGCFFGVICVPMGSNNSADILVPQEDALVPILLGLENNLVID